MPSAVFHAANTAMPPIITILLVLVSIFLISLVILWLVAERGHILLPSSRRSVPPINRSSSFGIKSLITYIYHRWQKQVMGVLINIVHPYLNGWAKRWVREHYHGKILTHELAEAIITLDHEIPQQDLGRHVIPYSMARDIVLQLPLDIVAYECACRGARAQHCEPTQVCMIIGKPFTDFTLEHQRKKSRRLSKQEALELLRAEHARGHVHSAFFKEDRLNRFYVICNCCSCCCGGIEAMTRYHNPILISSGYVAQVDETTCTSCGLCEDACPFGALSSASVAQVDWEKCMGCSVCQSRCPQDAIVLRPDPRKGIPLDVRQL